MDITLSIDWDEEEILETNDTDKQHEIKKILHKLELHKMSAMDNRNKLKHVMDSTTWKMMMKSNPSG